MNKEHSYQVKVEWQHDRIGEMSSPVLEHKISVATPPEFPKGVEGIWSPEHLFVAAINSCIMTTFLAIAENSKLEFNDFESVATGKLEMVEGKYMITEVSIEAAITIPDEEQYDRALRILNKSEAACLISNSVKSKIIFTPKVKVLNKETV